MLLRQLEFNETVFVYQNSADLVIIKKIRSWECGSVGRMLATMHKALSLVSSTVLTSHGCAGL